MPSIIATVEIMLGTTASFWASWVLLAPGLGGSPPGLDMVAVAVIFFLIGLALVGRGAKSVLGPSSSERGSPPEGQMFEWYDR